MVIVAAAPAQGRQLLMSWHFSVPNLQRVPCDESWAVEIVANLGKLTFSQLGSILASIKEDKIRQVFLAKPCIISR
jgi:hypothetical protein